MSYRSLSSCSTGILGLIVASVWGEFQNFNNRNDIIPPIAADNKHIQISLDTHIFFTTSTSCNWMLFVSVILTVCNWLIPTSGPKCTVYSHLAWEHTVYYTKHYTHITAKFNIRRNFPTVLYYLNTTRSLDIKRRLRQISYHQTKGQIVISNTNTGGITRVYRDEKLQGWEITGIRVSLASRMCILIRAAARQIKQ